MHCPVVPQPATDAELYPRVADVMERWVAQVFAPGVTPAALGEMHFRHGLALVMAGIRSVGSDKRNWRAQGSP